MAAISFPVNLPDPVRTGFSAAVPEDFLSTTVGSSATATRDIQRSKPRVYTVNWDLNELEMKLFMLFYQNELNGGASWFNMRSPASLSFRGDFRFISPPTFSARSATRFSASATLEFLPGAFAIPGPEISQIPPGPHLVPEASIYRGGFGTSDTDYIFTEGVTNLNTSSATDGVEVDRVFGRIIRERDLAIVPCWLRFRENRNDIVGFQGIFPDDAIPEVVNVSIAQDDGRMVMVSLAHDPTSTGFTEINGISTNFRGVVQEELPGEFGSGDLIIDITFPDTDWRFDLPIRERAGTDIQWPLSLPFAPTPTGFTVSIEPQTERVETDGGIALVRRIRTNSHYNVACSWDFFPTQFSTFQSFYANDLSNGTAQFFFSSWRLFDRFTFAPSPYTIQRPSSTLFVVSANLRAFL